MKMEMSRSVTRTSRVHRWGVLILGLALLGLGGCGATSHHSRGEKFAAAENWDQAVLAFSKALAEDPGNTRYKVSLARARLKASQNHFERGKKYLAADQLEAALAELQQTVFLDPSNQYAANELAKAIREYERRQGKEASTIDEMKKKAKLEGRLAPQLNPRSNIPIKLRFKDEPIKKIYDALSKASGVNFLYDERVDLNRKISVDLAEVTFERALDVLMLQNKHFYKVWDENTILISDDNQQKHKEYDDLVIQTFYLSNADVKDVQVLLRTLLDARQLAQNDRLNAITIRDTPQRVAVAEKIIESNDKAKAELIVNVELLELNRNTLQTLGIDLIGSGGGAGKSIGLNFTAAESLPLNNLGLLNQTGNWSLGPIPGIILNFLKSDSDAKVIAKPQLRVSEGEKATVRIGDRIPIPTTTFNTAQTVGGSVVPITSFTYQNVGINIDIEPRVHHNKEVTLKLRVEVSSLAGQVSTGGGVSQPIIGTREIETQIRLKDGETNLLAGLIRQEERTSLSSVPGLGHIPVLKHLFGNNDTSVQQTDIVLTLTPRIIRIPDITEEDLKPLWIGTDKDVALRGSSRSSPFGSIFAPDGSAPPENSDSAPDSAATSVSTGLVTPPRVENRGVPRPGVGGAGDAEPGGAAPDSGDPRLAGSSAPPISGGSGSTEPVPRASVTFEPPNILAAVGNEFEVAVMIQGATNVGSIPFHVAYDPKVLEFVRSEEGNFLRQDGAGTVYNAQASTINEIFVALARLGTEVGANDGGELCTLTFRVLDSGNTTLAFTQSSVLDPNGQPLPATFSSAVQVMLQ